MNKKDIRNKVRIALIEGKVKKTAAGVLIKCDKTDKIFLMLRSSGGIGGNTWNLLAGGIEEGETPLEGLKRETKEETKINPDIIDYKFINKEFDKDRNLDFHYYTGIVLDEFTPKLDKENTDYGWFGKDELPSPLFPKLMDKIDKIWEN